jgi:hypothetical protein
MRIISSFHDFYDVGMSLDLERDITYIREPLEEESSWVGPVHSRFWGNELKIKVRSTIIGFCGRLYLMISCKPLYEAKTTLCYSIEDIDRFAEAHLNKKGLKNYYESEENKWSSLFVRKDMLKEWRKLHTEPNSFSKLFKQRQIPVFVVTSAETYQSKGKIVFNERLNQYQFFRVIDPMTAYQEVNMFVSNVARPMKPIPEVTDRDLVTAKGFDKWSFRKEPNEQKR